MTPREIADTLTSGQRDFLLAFTDPSPVLYGTEASADRLPAGFLLVQPKENGERMRRFKLTEIAQQVRDLLRKDST